MDPTNFNEIIFNHGFEPNNGTTPISGFTLNERSVPNDNEWFVAAEITTHNFALSAAPNSAPTEAPLRPEVALSLERSMREHADVWAALAKL